MAASDVARPSRGLPSMFASSFASTSAFVIESFSAKASITASAKGWNHRRGSAFMLAAIRLSSRALAASGVSLPMVVLVWRSHTGVIRAGLLEQVGATSCRGSRDSCASQSRPGRNPVLNTMRNGDVAPAGGCW
ncbi:hypothetical protein [Methylopila sp. M107]|uniref:hypothetical protein n=1 Tax=Methylopila sp. M107 TaxID=1101190 RepID=UPI0012DFAD05|nr:hypothetical protein [Methylopila sp. M107]